MPGMRRRLAAAVVLSVCAVLAAGCGGGSATGVAGQAISLDELSRSATTSADAASGRFAFDVRMEASGGAQGSLALAGGPFSFSGEGAFDRAAGRASVSVDMSAFAKLLAGFFSAFGSKNAKDAPDFGDPSGWKIDLVQDGKVGYIRFPALAKQLPAGKTWIRSEGGNVRLDGLQMSQLEGFAGTDPRSALDILRAAAGRVEAVGTEELHGTQTTHYRATIDPSAYEKLAPAQSSAAEPFPKQLVTQAAAGPIPVDVWLDGDGLVRKLSLSVTAEQAGTSQRGSASLSFEIWDYGKDVAIALPPADEVVDASALQR